jgi:hypothetical protein
MLHESIKGKQNALGFQIHIITLLELLTSEHGGPKKNEKSKKPLRKYECIDIPHAVLLLTMPGIVIIVILP